MSIEQKIDELIHALNQNTAALQNGAAPAAEKPKSEKPTKKTSNKSGSKQQKAEEPEQPTKAEVVKALQEVGKAQGRAGIEAILKKYDVGNAGALEESQYADVLKDAKAALEE